MDTLQEMEKLKHAIEKKAGRTMKSPVDFDRLSYLIYDSTRERISASTLKRLWGYVSSCHMPRYSSLSTLARYAGFPDWDAFCRSLPIATESYFFTGKTIRSENLQPGNRLRIEWNPDRQCTLEYQGDSTFSILKSVNTQLNAGDTFRAECFHLHQPLVMTNLCRKASDASLSDPVNYVAGYQTGLTVIQHLFDE